MRALARRYPHLTLSTIGILAAVLLSRSEGFHDLLTHLNGWGYISAVAAGCLFVSTITVGTGAVMLLFLSETMPAGLLAILAGAGAVIGDFLIFELIRDGTAREIRDAVRRAGADHLVKTLRRKMAWSLPFIGAVIIASPLPDELGVGLLGISSLSKGKFLALSYLLNTLGIYVFLTAAGIMR